MMSPFDIILRPDVLALTLQAMSKRRLQLHILLVYLSHIQSISCGNIHNSEDLWGFLLQNIKKPGGVVIIAYDGVHPVFDRVMGCLPGKSIRKAIFDPRIYRAQPVKVHNKKF